MTPSPPEDAVREHPSAPVTAATACEVLIVGGGPTGLFLACLLATRGVDVQVLERRNAPRDHSRAIGLHPPAVAALAAVGLDEDAVAAGVMIRRGRARSRGRELGALRFTRAWPQRPYVLSLPQSRTESLLEHRLAELAPGALHRGWEVTTLHEDAQGVEVSARPTAGSCAETSDSRSESVPAGAPAVSPRAAGSSADEPAVPLSPPRRARILIGADGSRSRIRDLLAITTTGREYPDTYLMGDFTDPDATSEHATAPRAADHAHDRHRDAVIHLEPGGVVESFPLPEGRRRWVVHTGASPSAGPTAQTLTDLVRERTGTQLDAAGCSMLSAFAVRQRTAQAMLSGRCVLVGDAAHEISPIGGQGITLGWRDALDLAPLLHRAVAGEGRSPLHDDPVWRRAEQRIRRRARLAGLLAHANTALGRPLPAPAAAVREAAVGIALGTPLREVMAWAYSMGWVQARRMDEVQQGVRPG